MIVYVALRNSIDWSGPPPTFASVGRTPREALSRVYGMKDEYIQQWLDGDREIRAHYSMRVFDLETGHEIVRG
jgi:hypothetical protein